MTRHEEIESMVLSEEELSYAIWQAKYIKWSKERNAEYWKVLEDQKPKKNDLSVRKHKD